MHTQFGMKIYLTLQESRGEGDKWGEGNDRREGKWEKGVEVNSVGKGGG